ncbi:MAG: hypothetical protein ACKVJ3_05375 [bacterium]
MLNHIEEKELSLPKDRILQLKVNIFFVFTGLLLLFLPQGIKAGETFSRDSEHRGILDLAPYQIYPENRIGNGIYLDKKLLDTHPQRVILNITSIKNTKSYVYLFRAQNGVLGLDIVKNEADGDARFWKVDPEFYQYTNRTYGIQRVFRIFQDKMIPLLTHLRTGTGVATSTNHAIFYHITDSKDITRTNSSGQEITQRVYTFRLHLINRNYEKIQSLLNIKVMDVSHRLKLKWVNEYSVSYKLSNGKKETVDLRKHAPTFF